MRYMMILAADPDAWENDADTTHPDDGVFDDWTLFTRALAEAGVLVAGDALHGTDTATTVRVRAGERIVTDGPFTETKEHLIGYYVIETQDLDSALAWAARVPNARVGSVEVRPLVPGSSTASVLEQGDAM